LALKYRLVEILCLVGIILLLHSASRTLFVMSIGSSSWYYFGLQGAFAPFENLEGMVGAMLAMNPLFLLVFTKS